MQHMYWLDSHIGSMDDAQELARQFMWNLTVSRHEGTWYVLDGEAKVFSSPNKESVDAFLYGLSLAYAVIPQPHHDQLKLTLDKWKSSL